MRDPDDPPETNADSDAALFRAAVGPVRKLPATPVAAQDCRHQAANRRTQALVAAKRQTDERKPLSQPRHVDANALVRALGELVAHRRHDVPAEVLRKLQLGLYAVQDELDLHDLNQPQAEALLRKFLAHACDHGHRCVRIIHGYGLHSPSGRPVLKAMVERVLHQRADVLAYTSAPRSAGGSVLVLLARHKLQ